MLSVTIYNVIGLQSKVIFFIGKQKTIPLR